MLSRRCLPLLSAMQGRCGSGGWASRTPLSVSRRRYAGEAFTANLVAHTTSLSACTSLSTMLYSPLGTAMLVLLAYNVVVVGGKHAFYLLELTAKDYVQDPQLYVIVRYGVLLCILLGMEVIFVEV